LQERRRRRRQKDHKDNKKTTSKTNRGKNTRDLVREKKREKTTTNKPSSIKEVEYTKRDANNNNGSPSLSSLQIFKGERYNYCFLSLSLCLYLPSIVL